MLRENHFEIRLEEHVLKLVEKHEEESWKLHEYDERNVKNHMKMR